MEIAQIIQELRCNDVRRRLRVAEAAADALEAIEKNPVVMLAAELNAEEEKIELLEERIAIMSEDLTAQEWDAQQDEARRRVRARSATAQ